MDIQETATKRTKSKALKIESGLPIARKRLTRIKGALSKRPGARRGASSGKPRSALAPPPGRGPRSAFGWFLHLLGSGLGAPFQLLALGLIGAAVFINVTLPELPDVKALRHVQFKEPLQVYSADGRFMAEFGIQRRRPVSIDEIPPLVIQAFVATEDSRFFEHSGVDAVGMARAMLSYVTTGVKSQGGSTISMQVTRNFFLSPEKTFHRKLAEILLTLHVEQVLTKQEIMELYLNQIFFGHRAYGISSAASLYYGKELSQLTVAEAAMLAGIPKAPSTNNPVSDPERALERRNYILSRMLELGYIDEAQYQTSVEAPDTASLHRRTPDLDAGYVSEMVRAEMIRFYGEDAISRGYRVTTTVDSRLQDAAQEAVRTSLRLYDRRHGYRGPEATVELAGMTEEDMDAYLNGAPRVPELEPALVTKVTSSSIEVYLGGGKHAKISGSRMNWARGYRNLARWRGERRKSSNAIAVGDLVRLKGDDEGRWTLSQVPAVAGALVSIDPHDGAVLALVGGYSFSSSKFNRAVDMRRQPGSSFKPFVYAAALSEGWTPASLLRDQAVKVRGERWNPKNADHRELGPIPMRKALALSRNLASINLLKSVGLDDARTYISRFGFEPEAMPRGLSMALGTGELSPVKLAEGYAVFANGGYHVTPYFIQRIEDADGNTVFAANPSLSCTDCWYKTGQASATTAGIERGVAAEQVIDPRTAYQMTSLLNDVIQHGTGKRARRLKRSDIVGKTGTTNDYRDAWFAGYQASFVTVAWMGFDDFGKLGRGEGGGKAALGMWVDFMKDALKDQPVATLSPPMGLVKVRTKSGTVEIVKKEHQDNLLGPDPVAVQQAQASERRKAKSTRKRSSRTASARKTVKRSAPRVMDDLF